MHDPCPNCRPGVRCRTPKCGRLKQDAQPKYCCHSCFHKTGGFLDRMIVCPECGNKRCPKATDHELPCTNSNEPGQAGSIYGGMHVEGADTPDTPQTNMGEPAW